jgi:hypothetical protein
MAGDAPAPYVLGVTGGTVAVREDLSDVITMISPYETPLLSAFKSGSCTQTKHEWLQDALTPPSAINAVLEGSDASNDTIKVRTRLDNECQIVRKVVQVSDTLRVVDNAGVNDEYDYQVQVKLKELGLDIEYAILNGVKAARGVSTPGQMDGVLATIATNKVNMAGGAITEQCLNDAIEMAWVAGGNPSQVFAPASTKRSISLFTGPGMRTQEIKGDHKLVVTVDVYESDFGTVEIHPHRLLPYTQPTTGPGALTAANNNTLVLDMTHWTVAWLRRITDTELARTGSSKRGMIEGELTLEGRAEKASAVITNYVNVAAPSA